MDDVEIEAFKQEWIKQVTENGKKVEGKSQHCIDVGIVVCRFKYKVKATTKKKKTATTGPNMTSIIVSHDEMSTITLLTGTSA